MNRFFLMMFAVLCFTACDKLSSTLGDTSDYDFLKEVLGDKPEQMKVEEVTFSPDYKTLTMSANVIHDFGPYELNNPKSVRAEVVETIDGTAPTLDHYYSKWTRESTGGESFSTYKWGMGTAEDGTVWSRATRWVRVYEGNKLIVDDIAKLYNWNE